MGQQGWKPYLSLSPERAFRHRRSECASPRLASSRGKQGGIVAHQGGLPGPSDAFQRHALGFVREPGQFQAGADVLMQGFEARITDQGRMGLLSLGLQRLIHAAPAVPQGEGWPLEGSPADTPLPTPRLKQVGWKVAGRRVSLHLPLAFLPVNGYLWQPPGARAFRRSPNVPYEPACSAACARVPLPLPVGSCVWLSPKLPNRPAPALPKRPGE